MRTFLLIIALAANLAASLACCCPLPPPPALTPEQLQAQADAKAARQKQAEQEQQAALEKAEQQRAINAAKPRPTRENYNKVLNGMTIDQVEAILGPGKENMRVGQLQVLSFHEFLGPSITVTFDGGLVSAKSCFD